MLDVGRIHQLEVEKTDERGIWLRSAGEPLLLPRREAHEAAAPGETLTVFVYRDASGKLRPTLKLPIAQVGECALLQVRSVGPHGAFLDWGVEKDLLCPLSQQPLRMIAGQGYLVRIALDREGRPFASARLDDWLEERCTELENGDPVDLLLWTFTDLGAKVIVNHRWIGVLYRDELRGAMKPGARLTGYVKRVREDGKLDLTLRQVGTEGALAAREQLLAGLRAADGFLPLHDRSTPEEIERRLGLSKKSFKKAVGGLLKEGLVELSEAGVRLKEGAK